MNNEIQVFPSNIFMTRINAVNAINLEQYIYTLADRMLPGYKGGQWEFVKTPNGARYMRFPFEGKQDMSFGLNEATLAFDGAGIAITLMALSHYSFSLYHAHSNDTNTVSEMFHALRSFALEHEEAAGIFRLID